MKRRNFLMLIVAPVIFITKKKPKTEELDNLTKQYRERYAEILNRIG